MMERLPTELGVTGPHAVQTRGLVKRFGNTVALAGVDLTIPEGAVYVLVGPNGAGKTTTLKVLLDLVVADSGVAEVCGIDSRAEGAAVRARVGYVPEQFDAAYGWLRVGALMRYHANYYPSWDDAYAGELARVFEIRRGARLSGLSKGHKRRVQLLLALAHRPPVLVLDEPTDGLDPVMRARTLSAIAEHLARFPTTVLMSTHLVHEAEGLGDHLGVMQAGRVGAQLTRDALRQMLRTYRLQVPEGWSGAPALDRMVLRRNGSAREMGWTIWGDQAEVTQRLAEAGATIRQVDVLTLEEAALVLLWRDETAPRSEQRETGHGIPAAL